MTGKPCNIIRIDKNTKRINFPNILLMTRSFEIIGKFPHYRDWHVSLVGNDIDEIAFTVNKYVNGKLCPVWDKLIDLKIIDVEDFGRFEISVNYTDNTQTVKLVHGKALEVELGQIPLYEFHVNDDDAASMEITEYNKNDFDEHGKFIPTVFYNPDDEDHSLLHRVIADKAPHWSIGHVTPYIALSEEEQPEKSDEFQRTYTCDGTTIYDFLTDEVAKESNVVFIFDTVDRRINCYSLCDCIDQETGEILERGIGEDTTVLVSKHKLANEITITSNKDNIKNCFRIEGGDDVITDMVRVANINGSNYIYQFSDSQYDDMPEELAAKIKSYNEGLSAQAETYYGENGIYTRLCKKYDDLSYYESTMMPEVNITDTTAEEQYNKMVDSLINMTIGVSSVNNYNNNLFQGVTNNVEAMAKILIDSRYNAKVIDGSISYNSATHKWQGNIQVTRAIDDTDYYPKTPEDISATFSVEISDDELTFTKQKIEKALSKGSMLDIDFDVAEMDEDEIKEYFSQYCLNRLKSFYDGYNSCLSALMSLNTESSTYKELYGKYYTRMTIVENILNERQAQVDTINTEVSDILREQSDFQNEWNLQKYLGENLYKIFCSYRREDSYTNNNYISDGLSTTECIEKAKELVDAATKEIKKTCALQRTVSTNLNNLFVLPEFEPLYEKFSLFNYIRIRTEDEILKLRLLGIDFNGDSVNEINVTFSEEIEPIDGKTNRTRKILKQASNISTSYPSTALQAKKGAQAKEDVTKMHENGLNAAETKLSNNDNGEVTVTPSGIISRKMEDEGFYNGKQFRITGNKLVFTKDNWKTTELAVGETTFYDPIAKEEKTSYGILAPSIVGKMILGETLGIYSNNNSLTFDANGLQVTNNINTFKVDPNSDKLISLKKKTEDIFYVDDNGNINFSGSIKGSSGEFTKSFDVKVPIYNGAAEWNMKTSEEGVYIGTTNISTDPSMPSCSIGFSSDGLNLYASHKDIGIRAFHGNTNIFSYGSINMGAIGGDISIESMGNIRMKSLLGSLSGLVVDGTLSVTGSKNRIAHTKNYNDRLLYCYEMTSPFFGDIGHGTIGEDGLCYVDIEPIFGETIDTSHEYYVFTQSYSNNPVYIYKKEPNYFIVKGTPSIEFDWEIKAKQVDCNIERLEEFVKDRENFIDFDYVRDTEEYLSNYEKELIENG